MPLYIARASCEQLTGNISYLKTSDMITPAGGPEDLCVMDGTEIKKEYDLSCYDPHKSIRVSSILDKPCSVTIHNGSGKRHPRVHADRMSDDSLPHF